METIEDVGQNQKRVVLIVDDESSVLRAVGRMLAKYADEILTASGHTEAEAILESRSVTHILCDHWFGRGLPLGLDLAAKWKTLYPKLEKVVVLTGVDIDALSPSPLIDAVLPKTTDPEKLASTLGLTLKD